MYREMDDSDMDEGVTKIEDLRQRSGVPGDGVVPQRPPRKRLVGRNPSFQLRSLKCFEDVDLMVKKGELIRSIVSFIQQDKTDSEGNLIEGELKDMSSSAVWHLVNNYRKYLMSDDAVVDKATPQDRPEEEDPFFELYKMQEHFKLMDQRIAMETATEKNLTKLFSTTHKEFLTAARLGDLIMMKKEKLGLLRKERGGVRQRVGSGAPGRLDLSEIVSNPESRQRVLGFVEALFGDPELLEEIGGKKKEAEEKPKKVRSKREKRKRRISPRPSSGTFGKRKR